MNKVSLIVPIYNAEAFLTNCIESLLNQSYTNIEIILVNDGSQDKSAQICSHFAAMDNRIIYIRKDNSGAAETRNMGIQHATGTYAMFIDADDWIEKDCVKKLVAALEKNNCDVAVGCLIDVFDNKSPSTRPCPVSLPVLEKEELSCFLIFDKLYGNSNGRSPYWNGFTSCLFKLDILKNMNIHFPKIRIGEDFVFLISYFSTCNSAAIVPSGIYYYRHSGDSVSTTYTHNLVEQNSIFIKKVQEITTGLPSFNAEALIRFVARTVASEFSNALCGGHNCKTICAELKQIRQSSHYHLYIKGKKLIDLPRTARIIYWLIHNRLYSIVAIYYVFIHK